MVEAVELAEPAYRLEPVARTFHGGATSPCRQPRTSPRASGSALGPSLAPDELVRLEVPAPEIGTRRIRATVLTVDRFGNVQLSLVRPQLEQVGIEDGAQVEIAVGFERYYAVAARTFAEVRPGDIVLYEDAYGNVSLAVNKGNAAEMFGIGVGRALELAGVRAVNELALSLSRRFARLTTRRSLPTRGSGGSSGVPCRQASTRSRRLGTASSARRLSHRSRRRSTESRHRRGASSTSAPARARARSSWRSGSRRPRSSESTSRRP